MESCNGGVLEACSSRKLISLRNALESLELGFCIDLPMLTSCQSYAKAVGLQGAKDGMQEFLSTFEGHIHTSAARADWFVDYQLLSTACQNKYSEGAFRNLFLREAVKFLFHIREGQKIDPKFVDMNLKALEAACKNYDMNSGPTRGSSGKVGTLSVKIEKERLPASFKERLQAHLQAAGLDAQIEILSPPEAPRKKSFLETFIAGGIAGAVSRTCTAPLDRLKLLLQTDTRGRYRGIIQGLRTIYEEGKRHRLASDRERKINAKGWRGVVGGFMGFFRGNGTNVVKIAPETAIKFGAYEKSKIFICKDPTKPTGIERFFCGAVGGITAQTCIYPLEIVKTRLAVSEPGTYKGISHCLFKISRKEGFGALYRGLTASVLGIIPYSGVDMAVYFSLRERYPDATPMGMLACGAVSSTCGMVCSFPFQLIRTRLQATGLDGMPKYDGIWHCFSQTVRHLYFHISCSDMIGRRIRI